MPYNTYYDSDSDYNSDEEEDAVPEFAFLSLAPRRAPAFGLHVVFVLDCSGSMRKCDVVSSRGNSISRMDAALDAACSFVDGQLCEGASSSDRCSLIIFNEGASTEIQGVPFDNFLPMRIAALKEKVRPGFGTSFRVALKEAAYTCQRQSGAVASHCVVFLSDGRPGDAHYNSKTEFELYKSLDDLRDKCSPGKLTHFHTIGFGPDDFVWLRKMAAAVPGGQFHDHAPKHGQGLSLAALLTTFKSISSGVTASRSASGNTSGQQTTVSNLIVRPSNAWRWEDVWGDLYVWSERQQKINSDWQHVKMQLCTPHFAAGASRLAFYMDRVTTQPPSVRARLDLPRSLVAKTVCNRDMTVQEGRAYQLTLFRCLSRAREALSAMMDRSRWSCDLSFIDCHGFKAFDGRYFFIEERLQGTYVKYNSNAGYVDPRYREKQLSDDDMELHDQINALSHFSYFYSKGQWLVCDLQGVGPRLTDPQINSHSRSYGDYDMGSEGIRQFFNSHRCNDWCASLGICGYWPIH